MTHHPDREAAQGRVTIIAKSQTNGEDSHSEISEFCDLLEGRDEKKLNTAMLASTTKPIPQDIYFSVGKSMGTVKERALWL